MRCQSTQQPGLTFFHYRYLAYQHGLQELIRQLRQLGLLTIVLLGTALPAVFFLLFYLLGLVVHHPAGAAASAWQAISLLIAQACGWYVLRDAILDLPHRLFQRSSSRRRWRWLADGCWLLLSAPLWWAISFLLLSMSAAQWHGAPQLWLLWGLLPVAGLVVLYQPARAIPALLCGVLALLALTSLWQSVQSSTLSRPDALLLLTVFGAGALPGLLWQLQPQRWRLSLTGCWRFWLQSWLQHSWSLLWRLLLLLLNQQTWQTVRLHQPAAVTIANTLQLSVDLLVVSSLLFVSKGLLTEYRLYFQSLGQYRHYWHSQFGLPLIALLVLLLQYHTLNIAQLLLVAALSLLLPLTIYRAPAQWLPVWLVTVLLFFVLA